MNQETHPPASVVTAAIANLKVAQDHLRAIESAIASVAVKGTLPSAEIALERERALAAVQYHLNIVASFGQVAA